METTHLFAAGAALAGCLLTTLGLAAEVRAAIDGVRSNQGHVICGLFRSAEGFPNNAQRSFKWVRVAATSSGVKCIFADLPSGTYAVSVFHDENDDGVLHTNLLGVPREGYGVSNNHTYTMHPPVFDESCFVTEPQSTTELHLRLKY